MRKTLRAFAAAGISLVVGGAIVALPLTALKSDEVEVQQRTAVYDPASLDSETADLIRTVTENAGHTNGERGYSLSSPPSGEVPAAVINELREAEDNAAPDDLAAVLSNLTVGAQRLEEQHHKDAPPGLAISDAGPKTSDDVGKLLDLVAGIEPDEPTPPQDAGFEDPGTQTGPTMPDGNLGDLLLPTNPGTPDLGNPDPGTSDPGSTDPGTTDPGTGPSNTDPDTLQPGPRSLTPQSVESPSITEGTPQTPSGKRRNLATNGDSGIPDANVKAGADADKQQSQSSKASTKIVDRVNGAVEKVEKTVKRVLEKLTPKRTATVDKGE